ncbi:TPA: hypothetical protein ACS7WW_003574 [Providencia alcalifaciens]
MNEQELAVKIEEFMKKYDPVEYDDGDIGSRYAKAFAEKLAAYLAKE